jgi:hypothetical protein
MNDAEIHRLLDLAADPERMRAIVREVRPSDLLLTDAEVEEMPGLPSP